MENNDKYIIKINKIIQQDEQTKHLLRGLKKDINFETINKEYDDEYRYNRDYLDRQQKIVLEVFFKFSKQLNQHGYCW